MFFASAQDSALSLPLSGRDPLGTQAVWQHRARDVVPSLTAASRLPEGFQLLLTALAWWPKFAHEHKRASNELTRYFLLFEQGVARACHLAGVDWRLPGSRRLYARDRKLWIGLKPERDYLLDGPLANGVWGIYRGPLANAGLLTDGNMLESGSLTAELLKDTEDESYQLNRLFPYIRKALDQPQEIIEIANNSGHGLVGGLAQLVKGLPSASQIHRTFVVTNNPLCAQMARLSAKNPELEPENLVLQGQAQFSQEFRETLTQLENCERYLACLDGWFEALCCQGGKRLAEAAKAMACDLPALRTARARFYESGHYVGLAAIRHRELSEAELGSPEAFTTWLLAHHSKIRAPRRMRYSA